jgi:hypothetical protein
MRPLVPGGIWRFGWIMNILNTLQKYTSDPGPPRNIIKIEIQKIEALNITWMEIFFARVPANIYFQEKIFRV